MLLRFILYTCFLMLYTKVMTATGHALVGTVLAVSLQNPALGLPVAVLSHVASDAFPHWDTGTNMHKHSTKRFVAGSFLDLGLSLTLPFLVAHFLFPATNFLYLFSMIIAAQLLDWLSAPYVFLNLKIPPFSWVYKLQCLFDNRLDKPWGIIGQGAFLIFLIIIVKILVAT